MTKLLILSNAPPLPLNGGYMTFYRHFCQRDDFSIVICSDNFSIYTHVPEAESYYLADKKILGRLRSTRLWLALGTMERLGISFSVDGLPQLVERVNPDAVFTVGGPFSTLTVLAEKVARRYELPLIASFNDWFDYGWFPVYERFRSKVERKFREFYQRADLALCTSEGMRDALGEHPNSHVWYPTGAPIKDKDGYVPKPVTRENSLIALFGGSLGDWYGPMMESLVTECERGDDPIEFRIFGALEAWSENFDRHAREKGIFRGRVDFETLVQEAAQADLLILPMGFGESCAHVERTSFKTKFLDYLSFRRPILVWGPEYCSAVRVAREFDSAECVTDPSPSACRMAIARLAGDPDRRLELMENALKMYDDRFHPDRIHEGLVRKIEDVVSNHRAKTA